MKNDEMVSSLDELIDRSLVCKWLLCGLFWLMFTPSVGMTISTLFNYPEYLGDSMYLTFGRLRPMHVNGVIFAAFSTLFIGICYYVVPKLTGVRIYMERLGHILLWAWNFALALGMVSLAMGYNQGLEAGEMPLLVDILIFIVMCLLTMQFLMTVVNRKERQMYVSLWYLVAALCGPSSTSF